MKLSTAKIYKIFGLDAYKEKYGEFIHDVKTELLEKQIEDISNFLAEHYVTASERNYIICIEIKNELWIREMFNNYG